MPPEEALGSSLKPRYDSVSARSTAKKQPSALFVCLLCSRGQFQEFLRSLRRLEYPAASLRCNTRFTAQEVHF